MSTHLKPAILEAAILNTERDNDFFTATVVGLPRELVLGRAYTERKLSQTPSLTIDALTAAVWHSHAAQVLLNAHIKQSHKKLGLTFFKGNLTRKRAKKSGFLAFLLGFALCAALCCAYYAYYAYNASMPQTWLQHLLNF